MNNTINSSKKLKETLTNFIMNENITPNNRRIAEYILLNYKSVAFMTASELAEKIGVSQPTITRFVAIHLKIDRFSKFIKEIQNIIRLEVTTLDRHQMKKENQDSDFYYFIDQEIDSLKSIGDYISEEKLDYIAKKIAGKKKILILGFRSAKPLADYFYFFLRKIHPNVQVCFRADSEVLDTLHSINVQESLILLFAFPRYPNEMINVIKYLKEKKYPCITISDSYKLQEIGVCNVDLVTPITLNNLFDSYTSTFSVLSILLDKIGRVDFEQSQTMLNNLEDLYRKNQVFFTEQNAAQKGNNK
ncbi:MurR/RpiR family transcriptional regulator [Oceanobacillus sp. FSL K6-2867]|uniref:MurR/RpiR family transcriptional regulator n=1 Tax=Oceanobacillus sp. FSL K6-2867 TaxID=2954748 RepID=UPI0030D9FF8C